MSEKRENKLSVDEHYVRPQIANGQMKIAQNARQTVYLYGATGTGKTSFVEDSLIESDTIMPPCLIPKLPG